MIYQICDAIKQYIRQDEFLDIFLNHNSLTHQTWSTDRVKQGQYFSESFEQFGRVGLSSRPFSI